MTTAEKYVFVMVDVLYECEHERTSKHLHKGHECILFNFIINSIILQIKKGRQQDKERERELAFFWT